MEKTNILRETFTCGGDVKKKRKVKPSRKNFKTDDDFIVAALEYLSGEATLTQLKGVTRSNAEEAEAYRWAMIRLEESGIITAERIPNHTGRPKIVLRLT